MFKFLTSLFRKKADSVDSFLMYPEGKRYYRESHSIRRANIDEDAIKIINRLNKFRYKAYLVGGGVRDLLMGKRPKDFDIVTSATPNQIKRVFNNCRIIGKRFKIVHIIFKGKIIEVSTFRSLPEHRLEKHKADNDYLIKRDNSFGTAKEDAARRDFTINSLFYDPKNDSILDYVGGFEDIQKKIVRVIGDPDISFKEDPVRMLRAVKFSVLLGLDIEKKTKLAIKKNRLELDKSSTARLLEEYNKMFRTWKTSIIFEGLAENHLLDVLFKEPADKLKKTDVEWREHFMETPLGKRLAVTDKLLSAREEMTPAIFYSLIFYDIIKDLYENDRGHLAHNIKENLQPVFERMGIPKREQDNLVKIFISQPRFQVTDDEKEKQNSFFKKKDYFYDAFMVYKIVAISEGNESAVQTAFFWEISLRQRPKPDSHQFGQQNRKKEPNKKRPPRKKHRDRRSGGSQNQNNVQDGNQSDSGKQPGSASDRQTSDSDSEET
ncbi:polynucleotide adenylyltransferase PcnB [Leptospira vanthielii]|uniref:Poly(A) polymerase I n=2 Tax=Leptospira vanthielii TaxID=293085 RepID=A0ABY2NQ85_9LEPT|nr:polynucleotide adenylyltransferase PcnB [Leptospira vanthielii]EMY69984.1 poly(A) polymerase [Leptospira vanthielii serovar Holland str. Waz Holland = ATCC 700522]TGM58268.1 polynucleotide adenylyltransferase PcnB [Leptospira vanthielii]